MLAATSFVWCIFFAAVGRIEQHATMPMFVAALVTIAFTTASVESLAIDRWRALRVISLQELPASLLFLVEQADLRGMAAVMLAFWVYQALHLWRRGAEYQAQLVAVHSLRISRAEVARLSQTDALTGVANRRAYESSLSTLWNHFARTEGVLSLLVLDLDHFKRVNDEHGHAAGDACLRSVASLLAGRFKRSLETVARIGGEEFAVVLPGISIEAALERAKLVCAELAQLRIEYEGRAFSITASIGVGAAHWQSDRNPEGFFARIDAACYAAKARGRNRVIQA
jgi:diguanylate cyclase (GGDEF)-like protein